MHLLLLRWVVVSVVFVVRIQLLTLALPRPLPILLPLLLLLLTPHRPTILPCRVLVVVGLLRVLLRNPAIIAIKMLRWFDVWTVIRYYVHRVTHLCIVHQSNVLIVVN